MIAQGLARPHLPLLPPDLLLRIFSLLPAKDLGSVSVQDAYLRGVAAAPELWQPLALARWPGGVALYGGDWHALYCSRAAMPTAFPLAVDRVCALTAAQQRRWQAEQQQGKAASGGSGAAAPSSGTGGAAARAGNLPALAFEEICRQTYEAGLACGKDRSVRRTPEWRALKAALTWWASSRPDVLVGFVRAAHELVAGDGGRGGADARWRRSAVAFLQDLGLLSGAHSSVADRVAAEAAALDRAIRSVQRGAGSVAAPAGLPGSHWWFD